MDVFGLMYEIGVCDDYGIGVVYNGDVIELF